ncbi:hypothetical protein [Kribbella sp. CA-293567]|uniref:hypothetical protein n=1 Tax=Kribbella sp. CA-293567 TaxID=3002436 RepID=UPI0022DCEEEA|nr:hypothetical protein [Kribbella sp. CA-293567]WBQ06866.1 hypothetical protein OX958_08730 [Kribbella sp. CA-293567]
MSEPSAGAPGNRVTRPFRRLAARVSRWQNTRRGTATLKGMYAQAARDAKRMDPTVRERIGRANLTKADLQSLAEAHITGAYDPRQRGYSRQLSGRAAAQAMRADQSVVRNRNPIRQVANRVSRWRNTRQGTATLKAAYAQAAKDVKRMDPAVRESIGRSRITKADLQNLSQAAMRETFRPEGRQTPYQVQPRFQQHLQTQPAAQAQPLNRQQSAAQAESSQPPLQNQGARARAEVNPELHNVRQMPAQAAPPRPQMTPAEAAAAQRSQENGQGAGQQTPQVAGQGEQSAGAQQGVAQGQPSPQTQQGVGRTPGRHREQAQGQGGGRHRQQGKAQQLAASYQALRQGPGRHRAGAAHQAGPNQSPATVPGQAQGLNLRQRLQAVKQFHQTLSNQSPAQQAATVAQLNSSATQQSSGNTPRTNGDAAKAFAGMAGANGAVNAKPTAQTTDRPGKPAHAATTHRKSDTKQL